MAEAEARATARTRQIEQWAEQVISHTRAEEARMLREQQEQRKAAKAELQFLSDHQDEASRALTELRDALGQALGLIEPAPSTRPETSDQAAIEADAADAGMELVDEAHDSDDTPVTGDVPLVADLSDRAAEAAAGQESEPRCREGAGSPRRSPQLVRGQSRILGVERFGVAKALVKGRLWLIIGTLVGVAVAAGRLPYLAGAGRSLSGTAEKLVGSGAGRLTSYGSTAGASTRVVLGLSAILAATLPGLTALALVAAAAARCD